MSVKISDLNSNISVCTALFSCVQYILCAYNVMYVRSMLFTLRCQLNVPLAYYFWGIWEPYSPPRYFFGPILHAYQFLSEMYTKKLTFISQFHIGVLLQIHCVFSENLTLGECLYIWNMMHILLCSCNKMFHIHKRRLSYFYIFWFLATLCGLLRRLRLLNSWSDSDLPPFIKTPRLFGTLEYVRSMLFMCVQCYLRGFNVIYVRIMLFYVHTVVFMYFQCNLNANKSN